MVLTNQELLELTRHQFLYFVKYVNPDYILTDFHKKIIWYLQQLIDGKITRLAISMPPGHGKSELCSRLLPLYMMLRRPTGSVLGACYGAEFARDEFGKKVRGIYKNNKQKLNLLFPNANLKMNSENGNYLEWEEGGFMLYDGRGGGFTGRRAHNLLVIDDVIKNSEEAESEKIITGLHKWYTTTARSRVEDFRVPILMLMTRWTEDDLIGKFAANNPKWTYINVPAVATADDPEDDFIGREKGEALWKERFPIEFLEEQMDDERYFAAMYQGNPVAQSGNLIKEHYFRSYEELPKVTKLNEEPKTYHYRFSTWDTAEKGGPNNDYTVRIDWLMLFCAGKITLYMENLYRGKPDINELFSMALEHWKKGYAPVIEDASSGVQLTQLLSNVGGEAGILPISRSGNKIEKMTNSLIYFNDHELYLPQDSSWRDGFIDEIKAFPYGQRDDQVDAFRLALQAVLVHRHELLAVCRRKMKGANSGQSLAGKKFGTNKLVAWGSLPQNNKTFSGPVIVKPRKTFGRTH